MFIIADEDIGKVKVAIGDVLSIVARENSRISSKISTEVDIGDGLDSMVVTSYWAGDIIRIDIKVKK